MFIKAINYDKFLVKVKIEMGSFFDMKEDEVYVVFKELDTFNTLELKDAFEKGETEILKKLKNVLPETIIDHNFYEQENVKMSNNDVVELLFSKNKLTTKVVGEYISALFQLPEKE